MTARNQSDLYHAFAEMPGIDLRIAGEIQAAPLGDDVFRRSDSGESFRVVVAAQALQCARMDRLGWIPSGIDLDIAHVTHRRTF